MGIKRFLLLLLSANLVMFSKAQKDIVTVHSSSGTQYGYALKMQAEIGGKKNWLNFRIGISAGAGAFLGENWCYPSFHTEVMLYNGGIGSKKPGDKSDHGVGFEFLVSYTLTAGLENRMRLSQKLRPGNRNYPLYYFSNFTFQPLQNPYNWSISWGGNLIFTLSRSHNKFQQVGFANVHLDRIQFSYINDGPPFSPPFGDKFDRFHTGGGFISLHGDDDWPANLFEMGFNKFTGYSNNAYELSNKIGTNYVYYHDEKQHYYNKSRFYFNFANTAKRYGVSLNLYNYPRLDVQHKIHLNSFYPLHMVPYQPHTAIGGAFYFAHTKIGLQ